MSHEILGKNAFIIPFTRVINVNSPWGNIYESNTSIEIDISELNLNNVPCVFVTITTTTSPLYIRISSITNTLIKLNAFRPTERNGITFNGYVLIIAS